MRIRSTLIVLATMLFAGGFASQAHAALGDGLVSNWTFDNTLNDSGPAGNNGTQANNGGGPTSVDYTALAPIGSGLVLDGGTEYISIPNESSYDFGASGNGFTISTWARVDAFDTSWQALIAKGEGNEFRLHRSGGSNNLAFNAGSGGDVNTSGTNVNDGAFHHIVAVHGGGGNNAIWVDGTLFGNGPRGNVADNDELLRIGDNPDATGREWEGVIDDVGIWDRPLSAAEIQHLYNGGTGRSIQSALGFEAPPPPPTINWDFWDGAGNPNDWQTLLGTANFRSGDGGGVSAGEMDGSRAHDSDHVNFLIESPLFHFHGLPIEGTPDDAIIVDMRGGMGDQSGNIGNYNSIADVAVFNGGNSATDGVKALAFVDPTSGQYITFILDPGNGGSGGDIQTLTLTDLANAGILPNTAYQLHFFDTDQGGWGWTQLNSILIAGTLGAPPAVPEPATAGLALMAVAGLGLRRRRRA